ncbi:MAG: pilus assembly protein N-terminal domain-containing protein [Deltaproteobacteria bacterium]|nr:pilus assembly protein N-terminal domain-containing protein [Deltaproteobacteria bacterium]
MRLKQLAPVSYLVALTVLYSLTLIPGNVSAQGRMIRMVVGEQKSMKYTGIDKVIVGNPRVADVKTVGRDTFILFATGAGRTNMTIRRRGKSTVNFTIVVSKEDVRSLMSEVRKLLGDREGISIRPVGDRVILDGRAFTSEDYRRVNDIVALYPQVKSFVKVNPNAKKLVANQLNVELQKSGLKNVEATVVGTKIFLEGSVESKADLQKAEMITKAVGEEVENLLTVGIKRMILVEIDFVEIKKSGTDHIGIKWPLDIEGDVGTTMNVNYAKVLKGPGIDTAGLTVGGRLNGGTTFGFGFMFQDGYARVLAQPKLVCASGEKAEFWSGGEVPIVVVTALAIKIEYKPFGVILRIAPTADRHGNIQMEVFAEVSDIDRSIGFTAEGIDVPGFVRDSAKTNVTVRHGQTIVLGNLFHIAEEKNVSKVPLLGHIPIIGELFKSRVFKEKKAEICIFVTPRIVNPDTPKILKMIADIKSRYKRAKSEVGFGIFD